LLIAFQKNGNFSCMTENLQFCIFVIAYYGFIGEPRGGMIVRAFEGNE
jgi:hypothetical protein